jgi:hypothetical protein
VVLPPWMTGAEIKWHVDIQNGGVYILNDKSAISDGNVKTRMKVDILDDGRIWSLTNHREEILWQRRARRTRKAGPTLTK